MKKPVIKLDIPKATVWKKTPPAAFTSRPQKAKKGKGSYDRKKINEE